MMKEAGVVLDTNNIPIYWHDPLGRTGGSLPDDRALWDVLWNNRAHLLGVAHSHPGSGVPGPSYTDVTTFAAVEAALGQRLDWPIITCDSMVVCRWVGPDRLTYTPIIHPQEPAWVEYLRRLSYM